MNPNDAMLDFCVQCIMSVFTFVVLFNLSN